MTFYLKDLYKSSVRLLNNVKTYSNRTSPKLNFKRVSKKSIVTKLLTADSNPNTRSIVKIASILTFLGLTQPDDSEKESELITLIKRSILLIQKEEFDKAEQMLHLALKVAQEQNNSDGITYIYDVLANLAYDTGEFKKAEKLFVTVMQRLLINGVDKYDNRMLHISIKLAHIFESSKDFDKAESGYQYCLDGFKNKPESSETDTEETLMLWALCLDMYAHFLVTNNRIQEASVALEESYSKIIRVTGQEHHQAVTVLQDLAMVTFMLGDRDTAQKYIEKAIKIGERLPDVDELESMYADLGYIYLVKGMYKESQKACQSALKLSMKKGNKQTEDDATLCLQQLKSLKI